MGKHGGGELCVVNLNAAYLVCGDQFSPRGIDPRIIRQQRDGSFDVVKAPGCLMNGKSLERR
jgi:hypothetical protein